MGNSQKVKLTKAAIQKITLPDRGQKFIRDTELKGFGLRIGRGGMSYFVEKRVNGKNRRVIIGSTELYTPDEARKRALKVLGEMADGISPTDKKKEQKAKNITLGDAYEQYKNLRSLKLSTIAKQDYTVHQVFSEWLNKPLNSITREMVMKQHQKVTKESGKNHANNSMITLRSIFNLAIAHYRKNDTESLINHNPVQVLSDTKTWHKKTRRQTMVPVLRFAEWHEAVMNLKNDLNSSQAEAARDVLILIVFTGLRKNEAFSLTWADVDFKASTLRIERDKAKNNEALLLPLPKHLMNMLTERYKNTESVFVFPAEGKNGFLQDIRKQIRKVTEDTGIEFTLHDLRRNFTTAACKLLPIYTAKRLVNHTTISHNDVTDGYNVIDIDDMREGMNKVSVYFLSLLQNTSQNDKNQYNPN